MTWLEFEWRSSLFVLITYDVNTESPAGRKRLRRVAKLCENSGQRVQHSVFECVIDPARWVATRSQLINEIDPSTDSLRFYFLGSNWAQRVEHVGAKPSYNPEGPLIL